MPVSSVRSTLRPASNELPVRAGLPTALSLPPLQGKHTDSPQDRHCFRGPSWSDEKQSRWCLEAMKPSVRRFAEGRIKFLNLICDLAKSVGTLRGKHALHIFEKPPPTHEAELQRPFPRPSVLPEVS